LLALACSIKRSRPGLGPPVFGDIVVEGLEDLVSYLVATG